MNYAERKKDFIQKRDLLLKQYAVLRHSALQLASEINKINNEPMDFNEQLDWIRFSSNDKDMEKLTRLIISLLYVENPQDKGIISSLQENIKVNNSNPRFRR